ncbi:MAG: hypothetical protein PHP37_03365 [Patescibacteria group bacterium]|nr:hypothetical protein [Patescibacteria group bacterium]
MMKKNIKSIFSSLFLVLLLCLPFLVFADNSTSSSGILGKLQKVGTAGGYADADDTSLASGLGVVANMILSLLGIIFIILIIFGGIQWMTAGGNEEQVKKAQSRIKNAIIGLVVTLSAYAIWSLIDRYFINRV